VLTPNGDATELGLYRFFGSCIKDSTGMEIEEYRAANTQLLLLKGAPDVLLDKCSHYLAEDGTHKLCDETFSAVSATNLSPSLRT
jgi:hypothetical protein